ncbi:MAG: hypothetical protein HRU70_15160 [Phycisphaeraceae bacterium]|nr:MAG: hypothetical protein HRU70_15160 [Phycisphaeraceae bacterium]
MVGSVLGQTEGQPRPVLVAEHAGLAAFASSPKDAALRGALERLPERLRELPFEVGAEREPIALAEMMLRSMSRPARMAVTYTPGEPTGGLFGYGVAVSIDHADLNTATQDHRMITRLLREGGAPLVDSADMPGLSEMDAGPGGTLIFGPRQTASGPKYQAIVGTFSDIERAFSFLPAATIADSRTLVRGRMDFEQLTPIQQTVMAMGGATVPQAREVFVQVQRRGLIGPGAMKLSFEHGVTPAASPTRALTRVVLENADRYKNGLRLPTEGLTAEDLRAVPADAVHAHVMRADLTPLIDLLDLVQTQQPMLSEALDQFRVATGVDFKYDLLDSLGGTVAGYLSDSTGGGGLGSAVLMVTFKDRARLLAAHQKLIAFANSMLASPEMLGEFHRYPRVTPWTHEGAQMFSVRFQGVPVPLEVTWAATDRWLIAGLTPQAVIGAVRQVSGKGDAGLGSVAAVAGAVKDAGGAPIYVEYTDTTRTLRDGYTLLTMTGSAIANGLRSPSDPAREPGLVVPPFQDLVKGAVPSVTLAYWRGADLTLTRSADASILVTAGSTLGLASGLLPAAAAGGFMTYGVSSREVRFDEFGRLLFPGGDGVLGVMLAGASDPGAAAVERLVGLGRAAGVSTP